MLRKTISKIIQNGNGLIIIDNFSDKSMADFVKDECACHQRNDAYVVSCDMGKEELINIFLETIKSRHVLLATYQEIELALFKSNVLSALADAMMILMRGSITLNPKFSLIFPNVGEYLCANLLDAWQMAHVLNIGVITHESNNKSKSEKESVICVSPCV